MPYTTDNIVDYIMDKDHLSVKAAVDDIMASKIQDALELRREYVGQSMFNPSSEETDDSE
jgi:hypothetical protein